MKLSFLAMVLGAGALVPSGAWAQVAPEPAAPPPSATPAQPQQQRAVDQSNNKPAAEPPVPPGWRWLDGGLQPMDFRPRSQQMEKGSWLGISTSPAAPALRRQLRLPEGTGLVVEFVQPRSPADEAGVRQYDLLIKLDDQLLINNEQFAVLVRTFKPDTSVQLTLLREGQRQTVDVKLAEHEVPRLSDAGPDLLPPYDNVINLPNAPIHQTPPHVLTAPKSIQPYGSGGTIYAGERSFTWVDGKKQVTLSAANGHTMLSVFDNGSGKILYQGPVDSAEEQKGVPEDVRVALDHLKMFLKRSRDQVDQDRIKAGVAPKDAAAEAPGETQPRQP